jgi:hypothetical protein
MKSAPRRGSVADVRQTTTRRRIGAITTNTLSRFIRTTWLLSATKQLELPANNVFIRRISASESDAFVEQTRKRNVFARHSWENSFYLKRVGQLKDSTVLEVFRPGSLDQVLPVARSLAELVEKVAVISSALGLRRQRTHQLVAISRHRRYGFDLGLVRKQVTYLRCLVVGWMV